MPYIRENFREMLDPGIDSLSTILGKAGGKGKPGLLNYSIFKIIKDSYNNSLTYADYNEIIGILECCKLEFYRAQVAPYEDEKRKENGPV